ncbi:MAG: DUF4236 domain-containing protein [Limisphaera sp.]|nr:DUF4236 domain-containing protein [Limisphaera sp.]
MGLRFWRRVRITPWLSLNFSLSGMSVSLGPPGAKITLGPRGTRVTAGLPGTGIFYTVSTSRASPSRAGASGSSVPPTLPPVGSRLKLGFFKRLVTPQEEEDFIDGLRKIHEDNDREGLTLLQRASHLPDAAFVAAFLCLKQEDWSRAAHLFGLAAERHTELGRLFAKYGLSMSVGLPVTKELVIYLMPGLPAVLLGWAEAHQQMGQWHKAVDRLNQLLAMTPHDPVVRLSLAELLWTFPGRETSCCRQILQLTEEVENETALHTGLLLYRGRALRTLGLMETARTTLEQALRRKKDRPGDLLLHVHYELALVYEALGETRRARREWEKIHAVDPDFEDVAHRLGMTPMSDGVHRTM